MGTETPSAACGLQGTPLGNETGAPDTGFGLDEDMAGLFPRSGRRTRDTGQPSIPTRINHAMPPPPRAGLLPHFHRQEDAGRTCSPASSLARERVLPPPQGISAAGGHTESPHGTKEMALLAPPQGDSWPELPTSALGWGWDRPHRVRGSLLGKGRGGGGDVALPVSHPR